MKPSILHLVFVKLCFVILILLSCTTSSPSATPTVALIHQLTIAPTSTLPVQEIWRRKENSHSNYGVRIIATSQYLLFIYNYGKRLSLLDIDTGETIWKVAPGGSIGTIVGTEKIVYLEADGGILAYSLINGQLLWKTETLNKAGHTGYNLYLKDGYLFAHETTGWINFNQTGDVIHKLDIKTGHILDTIATPIKPGQPRLYFATEAIDFRKNDQMLLATDGQTGEVLWRVPSGEHIQLPPIFVDDLVVMTRGNWEPRTLLVFESATERVLWQTAGVITAPVVLNDIVYVMTVDGRIRAYDLRSGAIVGVLIVNPQVVDRSNYIYDLASDESRNLLFVYYGESQELIAFKLIEE